MIKRNKLFILCLVAVIIACVGVADVFADATVTTARKARTASLGKGINQVVGVGDLSTGNTVEIDGAGAMSVMLYPATIATSEGTALNTGAALVSAACRVHSITFGGNLSSAGDYVLIYDAASATGTPKFEINIGTAKETVHVSMPHGATFSTGVFADANDSTEKVTITYDN